MLAKSVVEKCCGEVLEKSALEKCWQNRSGQCETHQSFSRRSDDVLCNCARRNIVSKNSACDF